MLARIKIDEDRNEIFYFDKTGKEIFPENYTRKEDIDCPECESDNVYVAEEYDTDNYQMFYACTCLTCNYYWEVSP